jgi:hypothetical protein
MNDWMRLAATGYAGREWRRRMLVILGRVDIVRELSGRGLGRRRQDGLGVLSRNAIFGDIIPLRRSLRGVKVTDDIEATRLALAVVDVRFCRHDELCRGQLCRENTFLAT